MYFDDFGKIVFLFFVLNIVFLLASPFIFANYDIIISPKPVEIFEQEDLLAKISSLESDNENLREVIEAYPPEPINYSPAIIYLGFCAVLICVIYFLYQRDLKEKELKILQEQKEKKAWWKKSKALTDSNHST